MQSSERGRKSFVVAGESAKTCQPSKGTLHHPAPRQKHESALGFGQFDDFEFDAFCRRGRRGFFARVTLVTEAKFDAVPGGFLYLPGKFTDLGTLLFVGGLDQHRQQMAERVHR